MEYIDWAVAQNFGVMDINVPAYVTHEEVCIFGSGFLNFLFQLVTLSNQLYRTLIHIFPSLTRKRSRNKYCLWFATCGITFSNSMKLTKSSYLASAMPILELRFF